MKFKRLLFYWIASFFIAGSCYFLMWLIMPEHGVFGAMFRMYLYHWMHPIPFILIPCFFYGIFASLFSETFYKKKIFGKLLLTLLILVLTVLFSSPFGGMLWHYYDMCKGFFPQNWFSVMTSKGFSWGLELGWLIVLLSFPYNLLGCI
ncbi:MAG: hypothetical protein IAF38_16500, partial [Bacteroidia bacterium]|nr:hypothetical protein [Bacteroidia bacterium]